MLVFFCLRFCIQNRKMWVYIDESGNLGSKGKFFLLAAVICSNDKVKKKIKNMIRSAKVRFADEEKVLDEIHAVNLEYAQRQDLINKIIAMGNIFFEVLVIRKSEITFSLTRKTRNVAYNYFAGLLVERIIAK